MSTVQVSCAHCGGPVIKDCKEYNRSLKVGRPLDCNLSCAAAARNQPRKAKEIVEVCLCGNRFKTTTKAKAAKHCSASCASRFSMTGKRREAQRREGLTTSNLIPTPEALKKREQWKYVALTQLLRGRPHEFEFELKGFIFDLALFDTKTLVEFDGPYHRGAAQREVDVKKEQVAIEAGFLVIRREVAPAIVIDPTTISDL